MYVHFTPPFLYVQLFMSRPPLPDDERRTETLQVRLSAQEKSELVAGAEALGVSVGSLMREAGLARVRNNKGLWPTRTKPRAA